MSTAIMLLKRAALVDGSDALGASIKAAGVAKAVGRGIKKVVKGSAGLGGDLAEGLGGSRAVGEVAGLATLGGGTYAAGSKVKRKENEWMWRHGFAGGR